MTKEISKDKRIFYILYNRNRAILVSKEEWEKRWLDWYSKGE